MSTTEWHVDDIVKIVSAESADLAVKMKCDAPFGGHTTYRVGGHATCAVEVSSVAELLMIGNAAKSCGAPLAVLGRGSNTLVSDTGWHGVVITLGPFSDWINVDTAGLEPGEELVIEVGGAVAMPVLSRRVASIGVTGLEWMVGVPGSIGGAVRMNAGGHGAELSDAIIDADIVDLHLGQQERWHVDRLELGFRSSALDNHHVVLSARLKGSMSDPDLVSTRVEDIVRWRRQHQPGGQNCGSVFVNPVPGEVSAGALIDELGLRSFRIGSAEVSTKHANFIQADSNGHANDVYAVMESVRRQVLDATGYDLRSEVRLFGFDDIAAGGHVGDTV